MIPLRWTGPIVALAAAIVLTSCHPHPHPRDGHSGDPPSHAPAHGQRRHDDSHAHVWIYYPSAHVYHCDAHDTYYVWDGGWEMRSRVNRSLGTSYRLELDVGDPWTHEHRHRRVPPGHGGTPPGQRGDGPPGQRGDGPPGQRGDGPPGHRGDRDDGNRGNRDDGNRGRGRGGR